MRVKAPFAIPVSWDHQPTKWINGSKCADGPVVKRHGVMIDAVTPDGCSYAQALVLCNETGKIYQLTLGELTIKEWPDGWF
jgi:hypothetical protein